MQTPAQEERRRPQAAGVLLTDEQGRVLLVHHNYGLRRWTGTRVAVRREL